MQLPRLDQPDRYRGLYVYDFGEWSAVGYTAEEIAILLEEPDLDGGSIYRIHNVTPDGTFELRGVSRDRFELEAGMFFMRTDEAAARGDFAALTALAEADAPPARARLELARTVGGEGPQYITSLIYPAEYDEDFAAWLLHHDFRGGDFVEGGVSAVTSYLNLDKSMLERGQLWSRTSGACRSVDELRATVRRAVQR